MDMLASARTGSRFFHCAGCDISGVPLFRGIYRRGSGPGCERMGTDGPGGPGRGDIFAGKTGGRRSETYSEKNPCGRGKEPQPREQGIRRSISS